jgi:hypothetical protein
MAIDVMAWPSHLGSVDTLGDGDIEAHRAQGKIGPSVRESAKAAVGSDVPSLLYPSAYSLLPFSLAFSNKTRQ